MIPRSFSLKLIAILFVIVAPVSLFSQKTQAYSLSGRVTDKSNSPMTAVTVSLYAAKSNLLVKATITDKEGKYSIMPVGRGDYYIIATAVGYEKKTLAVFNVSHADIQVT
jgi:iron complex outermembrane recepter protein